MVNKIRQIRQPHVLWVHMTQVTDVEVQYLREHFSFHPLDLADCVNVTQRPKINIYDRYIFLVLLFPFYDRRDRKILSSELDFFIGEGFLVTVSDGKNKVIDQFFDECVRSEVMREQYLKQTSAHVLHELLHRLQEGIFPMLDHVSEDIERIEQQMFTGSERRMVKELLMIKRNIVNFRRIMNAHKNIIKKLVGVTDKDFLTLTPELNLYFNNILERSKEIWEIIENQKETINALHETNESLISFRLNDIMKMLTAFSVSILPATLLISILGMNATIRSLVSNQFGFWIFVVAVVALIGSVLVYFKRRDWL